MSVCVYECVCVCVCLVSAARNDVVSEAEVRRYSEVFWRRHGELSEWQTYLRKIERGDKRAGSLTDRQIDRRQTDRHLESGMIRTITSNAMGTNMISTVIHSFIRLSPARLLTIRQSLHERLSRYFLDQNLPLPLGPEGLLDVAGVSLDDAGLKLVYGTSGRGKAFTEDADRCLVLTLYRCGVVWGQ